MTEEQLRAAFARFGDIIYVKIPAVSGWPVWCLLEKGTKRFNPN